MMSSSFSQQVVVTHTRIPPSRKSSASSSYSTSESQPRSRSQSTTVCPTGLRERSTREIITDKDIVVVVMGTTGAGKSTFINLLADEDFKVGHSLASCTAEVQLATFKAGNGRTGFFIDTPGFGDTHRSDAEILKEIMGLLGPLYEDGVRISGLLYLHSITEPRMGGSALKNLELFRRLCGEQCFPHVALISTMWGELERRNDGGKIGDERVNELLKKSKYWGNMIEGGSAHFRHRGGIRSAEHIMQTFMSAIRTDKIVLNIQRELVQKGLRLDETEAGRYLHKESAAMKGRYEEQLRKLYLDIAHTRQSGGQEPVNDLQVQVDDVETALAGIDEDTKGLHITFRQLASEKGAEFASRADTMESELGQGQSPSSEFSSLHAELRATQERILYLEQRDKQTSDQIVSIRRQDSAKRLEAERELYQRKETLLEKVVSNGFYKVRSVYRVLSEPGRRGR